MYSISTKLCDYKTEPRALSTSQKQTPAYFVFFSFTQFPAFVLRQKAAVY